MPLNDPLKETALRHTFLDSIVAFLNSPPQGGGFGPHPTPGCAASPAYPGLFTFNPRRGSEAVRQPGKLNKKKVSATVNVVFFLALNLT